MSWLIPESVQKRCYTYLVQRYLGRFFEEKLDPNQLTVDIYHGKCSLKDIRLDVQAINELLDEHNSPLEIVDGSIENINLKVPWKSLLKESSTIEISSLRLTFQPKQRTESDPFLATSMFESMWTSMTSSLHLAEDCIKQESAPSNTLAQTYEGLEAFAQTIDSILSRVKIRLQNTIIQLEYLPKDSVRGVGLAIRIDLINYTDESTKDPPKEAATDVTKEDDKKGYLENMYSFKSLRCEGVSLYTIEFSHKTRVVSQTKLNESVECDAMSDSDDIDDYDYYASNNDRSMIMFGKINGKFEVSVGCKQTDDVDGPKFTIRIEVGALLLFCSPRQIHLLIELVEGVSNPDIESSNDKYGGKPMTHEDYEKIEKDIQQQMLMSPLPNFQLQNPHRGWATGRNEETSFDDTFMPMKGRSGLHESAMSVTSTLESSMSSSVTSAGTEATNRTNRRKNKLDQDPNADIIHFDIQLLSLYVILLHEDILVESSNVKYTLNSASVQSMEAIVNSFFSRANHIFSAGNFKDANAAINHSCDHNHLRLLAYRLNMEGDQKKTHSALSVGGYLEASKFELNEYLFNKDDNCGHLVPLITFDEGLNTAKNSLRLNFRHIEKTSRSDLSKTGPKTDLQFLLSRCTIQFDVTLIDRICTLLNPQPICVVNKPYNPWGHGPSSEINKTDSKVDFKVTCPLISVILRFPKLDFRPPHLNELSWWQRNLHQDFITMDLTTATLQTTLQTKQNVQEFMLSAKKINVSYSENANSAPIKIAKAGHEDRAYGSFQDAIDECKFNIKLFASHSLLHETPIDVPLTSMTTSIGGLLENNQKFDNGPFSSKRIVHESDTPHHQNQTVPDKTPELLVPGEKHEIADFIKSSLTSSKIQIDITLPIVSMQLISKHLYEVIYNRINNNLLLWEPKATKTPTQPPPPTTYENLTTTYENNESFKLCSNTLSLGIASDSESDTEPTDESNYYSTYTSRIKAPIEQPSNTETFLTLNLQITAGVVSIFVPVRDTHTNNVIPNQHGEFLIEVGDAGVFFVAGYMGDPALSYVCMQISAAKLHHCEQISSANRAPPVRDINSMPGEHMHATIYRSEPGMAPMHRTRAATREMVTLCVRIKACHETHHAKTISVAIGFDRITLRHRMCNEPNSWISQLIDFFNVNDYPISGYQTKDVLTELYCHVWDSAIDYRPVYLPIRAVITIGGFSISSHLSGEINTSTLRFIAEDCGLFLSEKKTGAVDLRRDYVNVIELGVFEISLKTADKKNIEIPHFDLRTSNDLIRIRTCADSARALTLLIKYFADDGDLILPEDLTASDGSFTSPKHQRRDDEEVELVSLEHAQEIANVSESQKQQMNDLIKDAMEDVHGARPKADANGRARNMFSDPYNGRKVFYFPGEANHSPLPQVTDELGDVVFEHPLRDDDFDEDFCFIDQEPGYNIFPKNGDPEVRWLSDAPVRIIENHFSVPSEKVDPLRTPSTFPMPTMRYTLCEMTIIWEMYGGNDFAALDKEVERKKMVNFADLRLLNNKSVSYSHQTVTINTEKVKKSKNWTANGGPNRDHNVLMEFQLNKIRFRHEVYPESGDKASRQVLLVSEFEIRDRLLSSEYNKFLCQYTSQDRPKRSNADMIGIKMLHVRPDPKLRTQECGLKVSLLPLCFNIDQDALHFLIEFFSAMGGDGPNADGTILSAKGTPVHQPPIMTINEDDDEAKMVEKAKRIIDENLLILEENIETNLVEEPSKPAYVTPEDSPIYFRKVSFIPDVPIRLDYRGKGVDLTRGPIHGLVMGLTQLNRSEVRLKRIVHRHGLLGFDKLIAFLLKEWINDIKKNQIPSLLSGVGPVYSLVQLIQGIKDLFYLPFEQYKKDGRFLRGLHRGANSFTASTAMAALELTTRLIHLIQLTAETAFDMLTPGPSVSYNPKTKRRRKRYSQPKDIREGVTNAYKVVKEGFGETAGNIVQVATHEHEQKGYSGAVGGVIRQIPQAIIKPLIIATEATNNVLGGIRCQCVPDARKDADEKWRND